MKAKLEGVQQGNWTDKKTGELRTGRDLHITRNPRGEREVREVWGRVAETLRVGFDSARLEELKLGYEYDFDVESGISEGRRWKTALDFGHLPKQ